ncbi:MAG: hypothetical protein U1F68_16110 [Gammaproteobacteria bacterium]
MAAVHILALAALWLSELPVLIVMILAGLVVVSAMWNYLCHGKSDNRWFIARVDWLGDQRWVLRGVDGREREARLLGYYVHPSLVILRFEVGWQRRCAVMLSADAVAPADLRRLRVHLLQQRERS